MKQAAKHVADGFRAMASTICILVTLGWIINYNLTAFIGIPLIIALSASLAAYFVKLVRQIQKINPPKEQVRRAKAVLMGIVGVGIACWLADVLSTFIAVNIGTAQEMNPLGWPYSAFVALAYYIPISFGMYYLLYKQKTKGSFYAAALISVGTLFFAAMSFTAGMNNFAFSWQTMDLSANLAITSFWSIIALVLTGFNIAAVRGKLA
jgi:hypothetical protein